MNSPAIRNKKVNVGLGAGLVLTLFVTLGALRGRIEQTTSDAPSANASDHKAGDPAARPLLYASLFRLIARMEEHRSHSQPGQHVDMAEIESKLQAKIGLTDQDWKELVSISTSVTAHRVELDKRAAPIFQQLRQARKAGSTAHLAQDDRTTVHALAEEWRSSRTQAMRELTRKMSAEGAAKVEAYVQGPLKGQGHFTRHRAGEEGSR